MPESRGLGTGQHRIWLVLPVRTGFAWAYLSGSPYTGDEDMVCPPKGVYRTTWFEARCTPRNFQVCPLDDAASSSSHSRFRHMHSLGTGRCHVPSPRKSGISAAARDLCLFSSRTTNGARLTPRLCRARYRSIHGFAVREPGSSHHLQVAPLMPSHLASADPFMDLASTGGSACAMHQRVAHGQQNAHRRLPPGRNPGGCAPR